MSEPTHIQIEISIEEIQGGLAKLIRSEHRDLIVETIIENLRTTDRGLFQLYKAFNGVKETTNLYPLQEVEVHIDTLSTWRMDKDEMVRRKMIFQKRVRATVQKIDLRKNYPIQVKYLYLDSEHKEQTVEDWVTEKYIKVLPDFEPGTEPIIPDSQ